MSSPIAIIRDTRAGGPGRPGRAWGSLELRVRLALLLALALEVAIVALDVAYGEMAKIVPAYALPPIVAALGAGATPVAALGALNVALALASGAWNGNLGAATHLFGLGTVVVGAAFAAFAAAARARFEAAGRHLRVLAAISEIAEGRPRLDETCRHFGAELVPAFGDLCIFDVVVDGEVKRLAACAAGPRAKWLEAAIAARRPPAPEAPTGSARAITRNEPQLIARIDDELLRGIAHDEADLELLRQIAPSSVIVVPLRARDRQLGAITLITADSGRRLSERDFEFIQIVAGRAALALDNAGLFSQLSSVEQRLEAILDNLAEAVTVQDESGRIVYANQAAVELLGARSAEELMVAEPGQISSRFEILAEDGSPLDLGSLPGRRALRGEQPGPVTIRFRDREGGEESWRIVKASAIPGPEGKLAVNIMEDATETKRAELQQRLLSEAGEALVSSLTYEATLQQVAEMAVPGFADWCGVSLPRPDGTLDQVAVAHVDPEKVGLAAELRERYPSRVDDPVIGEVLSDGVPRLLEIPDELLRRLARDEQHYDLLKRLGLRSGIVAPMRIGRETIGVVSFVTAESGRVLAESDLETATELARRAASAVENARLYSQRSNVARTLERALVPPDLADMPGWRSATFYQAAAAGQVGGDFFDAFPAGEDWIALIGDVGGRGVEAASLTALARYTLRTAGSLTGDPVAALEQLDRWLRERGDVAICTVAAVRLRSSGEAEVVSAGHPPPLVLRRGRVERVEASGTLLGAFPDAEWSPVRVRLDPGDLLVLYTDGVVELPADSGRFGEERLAAALSGALGPADAVERVLAAMREFGGDAATDDAAMVALMKAPIESSREDSLQNASNAFAAAP